MFGTKESRQHTHARRHARVMLAEGISHHLRKPQFVPTRTCSCACSWRAKLTAIRLLPLSFSWMREGDHTANDRKGKSSHSSWVATRRGLHKPVSSSPPF